MSLASQFISAFNVNALGGGLLGTVVHVERTDECYRLGCIGEHRVKKGKLKVKRQFLKHRDL